jgi:hypothetical protein
MWKVKNNSDDDDAEVNALSFAATTEEMSGEQTE